MGRRRTIPAGCYQHGEDTGRCFYCNAPADTWDHTTPVSHFNALRDTGVNDKTAPVVRCCRECNSLLSDHVFPTLAARKSYLKKTLRQRYGRLIAAPRWEEEELEELGPSLRASVQAQQAQADRVIQRLRR